MPFLSTGDLPHPGTEPRSPAFQEDSEVAQTVKTPLRSLGREDPLDKEMATHSSILAWKIPWKEEPEWLQSMGSQRLE